MSSRERRISRKKIFLIGHADSEIRGCKLPSHRDCLKVLLHLLNSAEPKPSLQKAARTVVGKCFSFWDRARIPTCDPSECVRKLLSLHQMWRKLDANKSLETDVELVKRMKFTENLDNLFDIAHENALERIEVEEDRRFLTSQRKPGRPGSMLGVDMKSWRKEAAVRRQRLESLENEIMRSTPTTVEAVIVPMDVRFRPENVTDENSNLVSPTTEAMITDSRTNLTPWASTSILPVIRDVKSVKKTLVSNVNYEDVQVISNNVIHDNEIFIVEDSVNANDVSSSSDIGINEARNPLSDSIPPTQFLETEEVECGLESKLNAEESDGNQSNVDEYVVVGRYWSDELKKIGQPDQVVWAKKFINDIIAEAQLGNLHRDAVHINIPAYHNHIPGTTASFQK